MSSAASEPAASKLLAVAAASAAASSLLTYAVFRWQHAGSSQSRLQQQGTPAPGDCGHLSAELEPPASTDPYDPSPRSSYLSWDDYFMAVAFLSAQRSKDPSKQVGACIVNRHNVICGIGYNGFPRGCPDDALPWAKKAAGGDPLGTKYPYVCHAEMNAILNKNGASVEGAKVFVTMFPCNECAKLLIQAGISEVVYHEGKEGPARSDSPLTPTFNRDQQYAASRRLLALAGVRLRQHAFQRPVLLSLTNDCARPAAVLRAPGAGEGAAAAEAAAVAPAVATALQSGAPANGSAANGSAKAASAAAGAAQGQRRRVKKLGGGTPNKQQQKESP